MRIADLAAFVMYHEANTAENYPLIYSPYDCINALGVVDTLKGKLEDKYEEDVLRLEFTEEEIYNELDAFYITGTTPSIDIWMEERAEHCPCKTK